MDHLEEARRKAHSELDAVFSQLKEHMEAKEPTHEEKNRATIRDYEERKAKGEKVELWERLHSNGSEHNASNCVETVLKYIDSRTLFIREPKEPTLEERNAAVRAEWEAMDETDVKGVRVKNGRKYRCEWKLEGLSWEDNARHENTSRHWAEENGVEYRIVELPAPKIVPFTRETCPVGSVIKSPGENRFVITAAYNASCMLGSNVVTYGELMDDYTMDDGSPAGLEVRE